VHQTKVSLLEVTPDSPEAKAILRIQCLLHAEQMGELTGLWELDSGYSNIHVYVIQESQETQLHFHLVIQYGMQYRFRRRDEPLSSLLELDGFDMMVEYREQVLGVSIDPTEEQIRAFVLCYQHGIEEWIASCMTLAELRHPWHIPDLKILEGVFTLFSPEEQRRHLRAHWYVRDTLVNSVTWGREAPEVIKILKQANCHAIDQLYAWWKVTCVDYSFPPAPVTAQTDKRELPTFLYKEKVYKKVAVVGQVVVVPIMYPFFSNTEPGFDLVERSSAKCIASFLPTNPGGKEAARTYAERLSDLTNWQEFDTLSLRQKRGIEVRVHKLLCEVIATYSSVENTPL
jgi:hypothetical protein